jgi:hypothetical protein
VKEQLPWKETKSRNSFFLFLLNSFTKLERALILKK